MRKSTFEAGILPVLVSFCTATGAIAQVAAPPPSPVAARTAGQEPAGMQRWTHRVVWTCRKQAEQEGMDAYASRLQASMNADGSSGWELVSTILLPDPVSKANAMCVLVTFKRPQR